MIRKLALSLLAFLFVAIGCQQPAPVPEHPLGFVPLPLKATQGGTGLTSPGTTGHVLTSNGTGWVSSALPAGGGWVDSVLGSGGCDFSADSNQTLGSDTTFTVCGHTWTKENSANERAAMAVVNGQGLTIQSGAGKDYAQLLGFADRTAPILKITFTELGLTSLSWSTSVRVTLENFSESNAAAFNPDGTMVGIDDCGTTNDATHFYLAAGGLYGLNGAASNHRWFAAARRGPTATSFQTTTVYTGAPVATFQVFAERLAAEQTMSPAIYYTATATIPAADNAYIPIGTVTDSHSSFWNTSSSISAAPMLPTDTSALCVTLAAGETGGGDTFTSVIKKVRVQYRL